MIASRTKTIVKRIIGGVQQKLKMITIAEVLSPPLEVLTALLCFQQSAGQAAEFKQPAASHRALKHH